MGYAQKKNQVRFRKKKRNWSNWGKCLKEESTATWNRSNFTLVVKYRIISEEIVKLENVIPFIEFKIQMMVERDVEDTMDNIDEDSIWEKKKNILFYACTLCKPQQLF